jgi:hypothetical protein
MALVFFRSLRTLLEIRVSLLISVQGETLNSGTLDMDLKGSQMDFRWSPGALASLFFHDIRLNCDFRAYDISHFHDFCPPVNLGWFPSIPDDQRSFARHPISHRMVQRALSSVTTPRAGNTVRAREGQKNQNRQYRDKEERHHKASVRLALTARIARNLIWRDMSGVSGPS